MKIIPFPKQRLTASPALRNSRLAQPCKKLEVRLLLEGDLAENVFVAAGKRQMSVDALAVDGMRILFGGGKCA